MQVLCKATNATADVCCEVCGQGFLVFWTRTSAEERDKRRQEVLDELRAQHVDGVSTAAAHPAGGFNLPEWDGDPSVSAAALLGNAPAWATA